MKKPMFNNILIVCVGNICRSPMAEGLLKSYFEKNNDVTMVSSAGLAAVVNMPATSLSQSLLQARNIDISKHKARQLTKDMVLQADLILTMEKFHQKKIEKVFPFTCGKVFLIGKWENFEIPDPYGGSQVDFECALDLIEKGLNDWQQKIFDKS